MTMPHLAALVTCERTTELRREAAQARLAALARCCHPGAWARAARRARRAARSLMGPRERCCTA